MECRFLILLCLGLYAPNQCLAMEDLDVLKENINNISIRESNSASDEISEEKKVKWIGSQPLKEKINNISSRESNRVSDKISDEEKVKWVGSQPFNILAAEDDSMSALILKRFFKNSNTIVVFSNGQELLNELEKPTFKSLPNFIIMDGHMPVLDGWKTIEKLKMNENCPPIFAVSSSDEKEKQHFLELGVAAFIKKPASKEILFPAIYDVLHSLRQNQGQAEK